MKLDGSVAFTLYPHWCNKEGTNIKFLTKGQQLNNDKYKVFHNTYTRHNVTAIDIDIDYDEDGICQLCGWDSFLHGHKGMYLVKVKDKNFGYLLVGGKCLEHIMLKGQTLSQAIKDKNLKWRDYFGFPEKLTFKDILNGKCSYKGKDYIPKGILKGNLELQSNFYKLIKPSKELKELISWMLGKKRKLKYNDINKFYLVPKFDWRKEYLSHKEVIDDKD